MRNQSIISTAVRGVVVSALAALMGSAIAHDVASETIKPLLSEDLKNLPGTTFTSVIVDFAPGVRSAPHTHGKAFVYAYVLKGTIRSQLDDEPAKVYHVGEVWSEKPGARHRLTENVSSTESAQLLVVFVAPTGSPLKIPDKP